MDAWIFAIPAEWDALDPESLSEAGKRAYTGAVPGFWDTFAGGYQVYNAHGSREALDEIDAALADSFKYIWDSRTGVDAWNLDGTFNTVPANILAVMKDFITYDQDGNPTGSAPATFATPNFAHRFAGQEDRIFAGDFSIDFSEEFR